MKLRHTLITLCAHQTTDLELQAACEWGHSALAKSGRHRGQHEGILAVWLHRAQVPRYLSIICQSNVSK